MAKPSKQAEQANQGEGNRTADHNYRDGVQRHLRSGRAPKAAEDAKQAVEGEEADELRQAEEEGKQRASSLAGEGEGEGEDEDENEDEDEDEDGAEDDEEQVDRGRE